MKQYRTAIMGLGIRGKIHLHGILENPTRFQVVGLCDIDEEKMAQVAADNGLADVPQYTDVEKMLAETRPEVFVFVTYPNLRLSMIELGAKYGVKAISLEKPVAEDLIEAGRMVQICRENGIKAVVCHQQKYLSQMQALKKRIDAGEIGRITKIHVETQAWFSQLGTHYVDYMLWANGGHKAKWVCGHIHGPICLDDDHPAPDYLLGTVEMENGVHGYVECGYLAEAHNPPEYGSSDNRLTVYGTEGYVWAETDGFWGACTKATNGRLIEGKDPGWRNHQQVPIQTPYYTELADWLEQGLALPDAAALERLELADSAAIDDPEQYMADNADMIRRYMAFLDSDEYRASPAHALRQAMTDFCRQSGYWDVFIPAMRRLSPAYDEYQRRLARANELFLSRYPEAAQLLAPGRDGRG